MLRLDKTGPFFILLAFTVGCTSPTDIVTNGLGDPCQTPPMSSNTSGIPETTGNFQVCQGVSNSEGVSAFALNNDAAYLKWIHESLKKVENKQLICDADTYVMDSNGKTCKPQFGAEDTTLAASTWALRTTELDEKFAAGLTGQVGAMQIGGKGMGVPQNSENRWKWNENVLWKQNVDGAQNGKALSLQTIAEWHSKKAQWVVANTGGIVTADQFASGTYEVVAKVPQAQGLVWAIWTFAGQEVDSYFTTPNGSCIWDDNVAYVYDKTNSSSPLWMDQSVSPGSFVPQTAKQFINPEIDIEIPSNASQLDALQGNDRYTTMNMNAYRWTDDGGTGIYQNLYAIKDSGAFVDGGWHKYRFDWYTGDNTGKNPPRVNFFFDDEYVGTTNLAAPMIGGRLWIALWEPTNSKWNGKLDQSICNDSSRQFCELNMACKKEELKCAYAEVLVDSIKITPFKESNDAFMPQAYDQPDMSKCGKKTPVCSKGGFPTNFVPYVTENPGDEKCGYVKTCSKNDGKDEEPACNRNFG